MGFTFIECPVCGHKLTLRCEEIGNFVTINMRDVLYCDNCDLIVSEDQEKVEMFKEWKQSEQGREEDNMKNGVDYKKKLHDITLFYGEKAVEKLPLFEFYLTELCKEDCDLTVHGDYTGFINGFKFLFVVGQKDMGTWKLDYAEMFADNNHVRSTNSNLLSAYILQSIGYIEEVVETHDASEFFDAIKPRRREIYGQFEYLHFDDMVMTWKEENDEKLYEVSITVNTDVTIFAENKDKAVQKLKEKFSKNDLNINASMSDNFTQNIEVCDINRNIKKENGMF